jgi:hypothetical protein
MRRRQDSSGDITGGSLEKLWKDVRINMEKDDDILLNLEEME